MARIKIWAPAFGTGPPSGLGHGLVAGSPLGPAAGSTGNALQRTAPVLPGARNRPRQFIMAGRVLLCQLTDLT